MGSRSDLEPTRQFEMTKYIIRRLLLAFPTLIIITIVVFMTVRLIPGDIIDLMYAELQSAELNPNPPRDGLGDSP